MRYFGKEHGWSIFGLEQTAHNVSVDANNVSLVQLLMQKMPELVSTKQQHPGFLLEEVLALVMTVEHMVFDDAVEALEDVYYLRKFDAAQPLTLEELQHVLFTYMLIYANAADRGRTEEARSKLFDSVR